MRPSKMQKPPKRYDWVHFEGKWDMGSAVNCSEQTLPISLAFPEHLRKARISYFERRRGPEKPRENVHPNYIGGWWLREQTIGNVL